MAKDQFSFDIVSELDPQEVRNAVDQAVREVGTRFDFKGTETSIALDADLIELRSSTEDRLKAAREVLREKFVRRELSLKALSDGPVQPAARSSVRQTLHVNRGISDEKARDLVKLIKKTGIKVQTAIQGDQLRVSGKKKDDLQAVMQAVKDQDFGIPLQFTNYRP
jgi:cyclic-di-GMP-binding protein